MQIYRTTPYDDNYLTYLNKLGQDNWIYCGQLGDKLVFRKEEKKTKGRQIVTTGDDFSDFYKLYPNKKGKENARVMWFRLTEKERELAHAGLIRYIAYWKQKAIEKQFLPHPATWIHQKRWEDDLSDNVTLTKPQENIQKQLDEEKKLEEDRKWMDQQLAKLKANGKWDEWYEQAKGELPEAQRQYEALIITRIKMRINQLGQGNNI